MKVVLQQRVPNLGIAGDVVEVKDGYARNFLLPQSLAKLATKQALEEAESLRKEAEKEEAARQKALASQLKALDGKAFTLKRKADENGKLFGSVTAKDVLERVNEGGAEFTEADLSWEAHKETGEYEAVLSGDTDAKATVTITIEAEV